jgi:hypothetical protein
LIKRLINPVRGFKSMKATYATINGFDLMWMFKKVQLELEIRLGSHRRNPPH